MGYRLKVDEGLSDGAKRIVLEQIDTALDHLKPTVRNKDEAIHDARVCIKKVRALLRLMRESLGDETYKAEDSTYRDAAGMLSKVRDSAAMLEMVDKLIEHFSDQLSTDAFAGVRASLLRSKKMGQQDRKSAMTKVAKSLRQARDRVQEWPEVDAHQALAKGLKRVFKQGRTTFATAYDRPSVETFHEWRKQVKHLLYQTQVLRPLWLTVMEAFAAELKTLGKYLSEDHDLAILREKISEQLDETDNRTEIEALVALLDQRRNELQVIARTLGARIYAEKPRTFVTRTECYWQAWRSEGKVDPIVLG
jgi:CHAD domain-containing protein